ncbi:MAG: HipA domain-containing protein [Bacteroidota bacterium]
MNCLYCYKELESEEMDFHAACSRKIFGTAEAPELPYTEAQMLELARDVIRSQVAVTGVQAKLSLDIERLTATHDKKKKLHVATRFTIVGLWGGYILKPPTVHFRFLPEVEDVTMHLAAIAGMQTVPHSLIRLKSGNLAYITKRIDRVKDHKLHMEDMCQLTERLTEDKYKGSYEQIAKAIFNYSANPGLDIINFYEQVVFSFLTGNADMHLKIFSLIHQPGNGYELAPAYDMVASALVMKEDTEDLALTLNGRKKKLTRKDFDKALLSAPMADSKSIEATYRKFSRSIAKWQEFIGASFLPEDMKEEYRALISERAQRLEIA